MSKRRSNLIRIFSSLILFSHVIFVGEVCSQSRKSFLWKIQSQTSTVYVLGSLHFAKKEIYPLHRKIENAFEESDFLVVEADVRDIQKIDIQKIMESGFYPENDALEKHVSPETLERVKEEINGFGISLDLVKRQKPWFLAITLAALESMKLGLDPNLGIDKYFLSKSEGKKKVIELESLDYQIRLLSGFSEKDQELFLMYTLNDLHMMEREVPQLLQAWGAGDTQAMESILTKSLSEDKRLSEIFEKLIFERNKKMASRLEDFLRGRGTYFVVVGAAHLVGNRGIIALLKGKQYAIGQL